MSLDTPPPALPAGLSGLRVALVHDWLVSTRGGESVLASFCRLFPNAPVYTLLHDPQGMTGPVGRAISRHEIRTSWVQQVPGATRIHRALLPLFPYAIESLDLLEFDLVLSSSHCVAKGVLCNPSARHVSYIHTPMRYAFEQFPEYFGPGRFPLAARGAVSLAMHHLRLWDEVTANRVDHFMANSHHVGRRIEVRYRRPSTVVHPPVDMDRFTVTPRAERQGHFLMVGAFAPYKRVDLAIDAFNQLGLPLDIVGGGQDAERLKKLAGPTVRFLGRLSDEDVAKAYSQARAFIFPGEEDFGITPLEAMASGTPVIALGRGGAAETVVDVAAGKKATGVLFGDQSTHGLVQAVERFVDHEAAISADACRAQAMTFARPTFEENVVKTISGFLGVKAPRRARAHEADA